PLGFKGKSTPSGTAEYPINPIELMLASGATYVARGYSKKMDLLKKLVTEGISHKGFSFIDVLQICATFFPAADYYSPRVYELSDHDRTNFESACSKAREWDYNSDARIALGTFFTRSLPTFDEKTGMHEGRATDKKQSLRDVFLQKT
ncbi:MAG TPA: 2-oxoacid:ferredoxin oxidoreductase subunit beta, partial [Methanoregula sp.]|nr:2-oxoacid:ferredoxin oxidoreductase subunit beta [Methanoregula sp.]